jgi:hypothetical protein
MKQKTKLKKFIDPYHYVNVLFSCPNCDGTVVVLANQVNCRIFRHGINTKTGQPIGPHDSKESIEKLVDSGAILGCGKPFKLDNHNNC